MEGDVRWHHGQTLAAGQVGELKVWWELADGVYFRVQVKGRTSFTPAGQVHITVTASSLVDDDALIVATLIDGSELGQMVLVVKEAEFRRLAAHDFVEGREYFTAPFAMHADGRARWAPSLVPREGCAE